jgi:hypothetical protein
MTIPQLAIINQFTTESAALRHDKHWLEGLFTLTMCNVSFRRPKQQSDDQAQTGEALRDPQ